MCPKEGIVIGEVATPSPKGVIDNMICPMCDSTRETGGNENGNMA